MDIYGESTQHGAREDKNALNHVLQVLIKMLSVTRLFEKRMNEIEKKLTSELVRANASLREIVTKDLPEINKKIKDLIEETNLLVQRTEGMPEIKSIVHALVAQAIAAKKFVDEEELERAKQNLGSKISSVSDLLKKLEVTHEGKIERLNDNLDQILNGEINRLKAKHNTKVKSSRILEQAPEPGALDTNSSANPPTQSVQHATANNKNSDKSTAMSTKPTAVATARNLQHPIVTNNNNNKINSKMTAEATKPSAAVDAGKRKQSNTSSTSKHRKVSQG